MSVEKLPNAGEPQGAPANEGASSDASIETNNTDAPNDSDAQADDQKGQQDEQPDDSSDDDEPKVRKNLPNEHFVKMRQKNRKKDSTKDDGGENDDDDDSSDDDDDVMESVKKIVKPLYDQQETVAINNEINDFIAENPKFEKYKAKVAKFAQHASRAQTPITSIFYEVAGPDLMKIGAEMAKEADNEAKNTQSGGGAGAHDVSGKQTADDVWAMTPEEFEAQKRKAFRRE